MRMPGVPQAVTTYPVPPFAPEAVVDAKNDFDAIAARWADAKGQLQDARDALADAKAADLRAVVDAAGHVRSREGSPTFRYSCTAWT